MSEVVQLTRSMMRIDGKLAWAGKVLPDGPWNTEPDHVDFEAHGFSCILHRATAWCGYVAVPPGHPWHGKGYDEVRAPNADGDDDYVSVHGGLTYADRCQGEICHVAKPGEPDDVWWLGFDCNHSGDLGAYDLLEMRGRTSRDSGAWIDRYRDVEYVRRETERLAAQASAVRS